MAELTISDAARHAGVSAHTLRYYERVGLLARVERAGSGHRRYDEADLRWIDFLMKLRSTGMPIRDVRRYAELVWAGDHTAADRLALLEQHRATVLAQMAEVEESLARIDYKIAYYKEKRA